MTQDNTSGEDTKFVFLKLTNGDNIMCTTLDNIDDISSARVLQILDPIQVFSFKIPYKGVFIEKYIMQAWTPFSSATFANIPMNNIVFVGELKPFFVEKYLEYVTDPASQQIMQEGSPSDAEEDIDEEEEYDDEESEHNFENIESEGVIKKWYH